MNKKVLGIMMGGMVLTLAAQVNALTINASTTGNLMVQASATASASAQMQGMDMVSSTDTLSAQVNTGMANTSSDSAIVSLQGNSIGMIQSSADLTAYDNMVIKARPAVSSVNVNSDNSIDVIYAQPAKFLGIFSTSLSGNVHVDAQGNTTVHMPWYAFLYSKNTTSVQASAATAVQQSGAQFNAQADAMTKVQNNARVINAVSTAVQAQASANASASGSASY
jgi:hypothetical protein